MNKIVRSFCATVAVATVVCAGTATAEKLCQLKNSPKVKESTRVQAIVVVSDTAACPRNYRQIGNIPSTSTITNIASQVAASVAGKPGAQGPTGPQGPQGIPGPEGTRGAGSPPIVVDVNPVGNQAACTTVDLKDLCGDSDGCVLRYFGQDAVFDNSVIGEALMYIEETSRSSSLDLGLNVNVKHVLPPYTGAARGIDGLALGVSASAFPLWNPSDGAKFSILNFVHGACPGRNGIDSAPFTGTDVYKVSVYQGPGFKGRFVVYDN